MVLSRQTFEYQGRKLIEKVTLKPPYMHEGIFHDEGCFLYFKDSSARLLSSSDNHKINAKEAVLLRCGSYFIDFIKNANINKVEVIAVHLYPSLLKNLYIKELPEIIERRNYDKQTPIIASQNIISKFIDSLEFYFQNPVLVNNDLLELKIKELILLLVQSKNVTSILELITDLYSNKTSQLKKIIKLHLYSNLSVTELSKLSHLSLSSFKREFKKEFNDSPLNYIVTKKIEKAQELLRITEMSISEIAFETGFNDPHYFTRIFKKRIGTSPSNYRQNNIVKVK